MKPSAVVEQAAFADPEAGVTAVIDRLAMAALYHRISDSALRTLIHLTAQASDSDKVIPTGHPVVDLDELEDRKLIRWSGRQAITIT